MLYHLLYPLASEFSVFNVFRYITFRTGAATLTALFLSFLVGPVADPLRSARLRVGQPIREIGPAHQSKAGTPTMGGLLILLSLLVSVLLWSNLDNRFVWIVIGVTIGYGLLGFIDDYRKVKQRRQRRDLGAHEALLADGARARRRHRDLPRPGLRRGALGALLQELHARTSAGSTSRSPPSSSWRRATR